MLGIGTGEFIAIAVILLLVVGPDRMPTFFRMLGKGLRTFRRTSRELRDAVGFDELLREDPPKRRYSPPRSQAEAVPRQAAEQLPEETDPAIIGPPSPPPAVVTSPEESLEDDLQPVGHEGPAREEP